MAQTVAGLSHFWGFRMRGWFKVLGFGMLGGLGLRKVCRGLVRLVRRGSEFSGLSGFGSLEAHGGYFKGVWDRNLGLKFLQQRPRVSAPITLNALFLNQGLNYSMI